MEGVIRILGVKPMKLEKLRNAMERTWAHIPKDRCQNIGESMARGIEMVLNLNGGLALNIIHKLYIIKWMK